jgi:hypothetical protein
MNSSPTRPSPALIVALIALVAALAGTATALPGKGSVDKNDLAKGSVTKKAIKKGAVTKKAIKKKAVTAKAIADGAVTDAKIAAHELPHIVGGPGEPAFGDGGEGDCVWQNAGTTTVGVTGANPVGFYKDQLGFVHLQGIAVAEDGPGGDGVCDFTDPNEIEDGTVFTLPTEYAPAGLYFDVSVITIQLVTPVQGSTLGGDPVPGGVVFADEVALLEGVAFEPATAAGTRARPARVNLGALERLAR